MITTNPILLDGKNTAFGGRIIDASLNIEFSAASSFSISVVSESGTYSIDATSLRAGGNPMVLKVGDKEFKIFPVAYTIENSEGVKTLRVEFLDSSVKHLDKKFVLLKGTHVTADNINNPDVDMSWIIPLGTPYEVRNSDAGETLLPIGDVVDDNGCVVNGYGVFSQDVVVYYSLMSLLNALGTLIDETEKQKVRAVLSKLYSDQYNDGLGFISKTREKDFVGTVREVLSSWSEEIGLIFYWDPVDEKIKTLDPNDPIDATEVATAVERMGECSCKSSSVTRSIQNNVLEGNIVIGSEAVPDTSDAAGGRGGSTKFKLINPWEKVQLYKYTESVDDEDREAITYDMLSDGEWLTGMNKLMKAAAAGEDFYLGYVIHTLAAGYDAIQEWGYERKTNPVLTFLYNDAFEVLAHGASDNGVISPLSSVVAGVVHGIRGSDKEYYARNNPILIFKAVNRMIKPPLDPEEAFNDINRMERDSLDNLVKNTSEERIFQTLRVLAANYNRWYYSTKLMTNMKYSFRKYDKSSDWAFHALDTYDSPLSSLITVRDKNRGITTEITSVQSSKIPFKGEARDWRRGLPSNGAGQGDNYLNCSDGSQVIATGEDLEGCEYFNLVGVALRENVSEFVYDSSTMGKITSVFGELSKHAAFGSSYSNLLDLRQATGYEIEDNRDYGVILIDALANTNGLASNFEVSVAAPPVKEIGEGESGSVASLLGADHKFCLYVRGKFDYEKILSGLPDMIKYEGEDVYTKTYSFDYSYSGPAGGNSDADEDGEDFSFFAKGVHVPTNEASYVQNNVSIQDLSFLELISTAGRRVKKAIDLSDIQVFASNWAKKLSVNDPEPQYSQQISFVGIPESIPSIAEGLEGLSISVDENGVSTQVSVGSRKIKREIFEKRQRMISEAKYRSERSRLTLIPNGRFSTRFLAGTQL